MLVKVKYLLWIIHRKFYKHSSHGYWRSRILYNDNRLIKGPEKDNIICMTIMGTAKKNRTCNLSLCSYFYQDWPMKHNIWYFAKMLRVNVFFNENRLQIKELWTISKSQCLKYNVVKVMYMRFVPRLRPS